MGLISLLQSACHDERKASDDTLPLLNRWNFWEPPIFISMASGLRQGPPP
jgi:hypothetical protein